MVPAISVNESGHPRQDLGGTRRETVGDGGILLVPGPASDHLPAVLELGRHDRLRQRQRMVVIRHRAIQSGPQVDVASCGVADDKADRTVTPQRGYAHPSPNARLDRLRRDLPAAQHHECVDGFERDALAAVRGGHQQ